MKKLTAALLRLGSQALCRRRLGPFALGTRHNGAATDVPQEALLCHQVQPGAGGEDAWYVSAVAA